MILQFIDEFWEITKIMTVKNSIFLGDCGQITFILRMNGTT